jgi:hypothetical protein
MFLRIGGRAVKSPNGKIIFMYGKQGDSSQDRILMDDLL